MWMFEKTIGYFSYYSNTHQISSWWYWLYKNYITLCIYVFFVCMDLLAWFSHIACLMASYIFGIYRVNAENISNRKKCSLYTQVVVMTTSILLYYAYSAEETFLLILNQMLQNHWKIDVHLLLIVCINMLTTFTCPSRVKYTLYSCVLFIVMGCTISSL